MLTPDEEEQFWLLHSKTADELFRKAYRMCSGHEADAYDALQETYLQAALHWRKFSALEGQQRRGWLTRTLTNEVLQMWRAPHRSREVTSFAGVAENAALDAWSLSARSEYRRTCRAIACLQDREREVFALHFLAGYEISEVAEILEISASTVRVHVHNGRAHLRETLAAEGGDEDGRA